MIAVMPVKQCYESNTIVTLKWNNSFATQLAHTIITIPFRNHKLILYSPPHSVAIELKELEDILGSFPEVGLLLGSQGIVGYKHRMATPS